MATPWKMNRIDLDDLLDPLEGVEKPGRYLGGEWNQPPWEDLASRPRRAVLCYPDLYELGMSNLGLQVLLEAARPLASWAVERVFHPGAALAARMRERRVPLFSLETRRPLAEADLLGFSLQTETTYTNLLEILELAGIPLEAARRDETHPLVVAGGSGAFHPEPLAPFLDILVLGDGEEAFPALLGKVEEILAGGLPGREELLWELARAFPWVYVPAFFEPRWDGTGRFAGIDPVRPGIPFPLRGAYVESLEKAPFPEAPMVPWIETVHDRVAVEIMRGCVQGCRFCEAGMQRRPLRFRSKERILRIAGRALDATGHDQVSLLGLSASDHPELKEIMEAFDRAFSDRKISVALPSLRVDKDLAWLPGALRKVRKSTLTMAPEAATDRLRRVINKNITTDDLLRGAEEAWRLGWRGLKLYFMIGLPGETEEDLRAIAGLAAVVSRLRRKSHGGAGPVNVTISTFVPRPWTPFQWAEMIDPAEVRRRQDVIKGSLQARSVRLKFHKAERSFLEAVLGRGDRKVAQVLLRARALGARMDGWADSFRWDTWLEAFEETGVDPAVQGLRSRGPHEALPWDHLTCGVRKEWLLAEWERSRRGETTPSCQDGPCSACGWDPRACRSARVPGGTYQAPKT